jgi:hypothetical protein
VCFERNAWFLLTRNPEGTNVGESKRQISLLARRYKTHPGVRNGFSALTSFRL